MIVASLPSDASAALAAPDALRRALLGLEAVVADAERMSALRADGLLRGSVDPNESVAVSTCPPFHVAVVHGEGGTGEERRAVQGAKRRQGTLDGRLAGLG